MKVWMKFDIPDKWSIIEKKTETIEAGTLGMTPIGFKLEMRIHYLH